VRAGRGFVFASFRPEELLAWAADRYAPRLAFATGFGPEGCVLLEMIAAARLPVDVFTLDTGLLFPETRALWARLEARYGLTIRAVTADESVDEQAATHGERLWERAPDRCCERRKVIPLRRELARHDAWITAIRSDQTSDRRSARPVERDPKFGLVKVNPLLSWSRADVDRTILEKGIPTNPLHERGYASIGCWPCTTPVAPGEDPRAGRWRGREKKECGLHLRPPSHDTDGRNREHV